MNIGELEQIMFFFCEGYDREGFTRGGGQATEKLQDFRPFMIANIDPALYSERCCAVIRITEGEEQLCPQPATIGQLRCAIHSGGVR